MVDFLQKSTTNRFQTVVWTVKLGFLFVGIVSTVLLLKLAVPYSVNAVISAIPRLWISFRGWLAPPYLYIVVNFIIITIAASSSFQQKHWRMKSEEAVMDAENEKKQKRSDFVSASASLVSDHRKTSTDVWPNMEEIPQESAEKALDSVEKPPENWSDVSCLTDSDEESAEKALDSVEKPPETWSDVSCLTDSDEKTTPDLSASFRLAPRKSSETSRRIDKSVAPPHKAAKPLGVAKPKKQNDTLDDTWEMITEGRGKPLARHPKKSETWDVPPRVIDPDSELDSSSAVMNRRELRKLDTFNGASSSVSSRGGGGLTREKPPNQDELNLRVEAFIKKFNDDIRLQRQESDNRYKEMVNRGVN